MKFRHVDLACGLTSRKDRHNLGKQASNIYLVTRAGDMTAIQLMWAYRTLPGAFRVTSEYFFTNHVRMDTSKLTVGLWFVVPTMEFEPQDSKHCAFRQLIETSKS